MSPELLYLLRRRIRTSGPLRFDEFVELVLYSDPHGYYRNHVPGADSDYRTSPSLTPWFGRLVVKDLQAAWEALGSPEPFTVVEAGAGNGDLAGAALPEASGDFAGALRWVFVEPLDSVAAVQRSRFGNAAQVSWAGSFDELAPVTGAVVAHEVLDNFPFRIFEIGPHGPVEIRVTSVRNHLAEVRFPIGPEVADLVAPACAHLEEGDRFELRTGVDGWVAAVARVLERGRLLVVDYGDAEPEIWTRRPSGSLAIYRRGRLGFDPFEDVGDADITAHVNFSALERAARAAGLTPAPLRTQREWLESLGLREITAEYRRRETAARSDGHHGDYLSLMAERAKVEMLAGRGGLGDYRVFTAGR